jgi:hypothetical protein
VTLTQRTESEAAKTWEMEGKWSRGQREMRGCREIKARDDKSNGNANNNKTRAYGDEEESRSGN